MLTKLLYTYRQRLTQLLSTELSVNIVRLITEKIDTFSNRTGGSEATRILSVFKEDRDLSRRRSSGAKCLASPMMRESTSVRASLSDETQLDPGPSLPI